MEDKKELAAVTAGPLTPAQIKAGRDAITAVMENVMKENVDWGKIKGCGPKPTLLKPGAEKLLATFQLSCEPTVEDLSTDGFVKYRVTARILKRDGTFLGAGVGTASTAEAKYAWRKSVNQAEWDNTPEDRKQIKYGSGYDGDYEIRQVRTNPADQENTVLKMAKKRALVDAVLTVTAASDIFTQDIEDMDHVGSSSPAKTESKKLGDDGAAGEIEITVKDVTQKATKKNPKYFIHANGGYQFQTFDKDLAVLAKKYKGSGVALAAKYVVSKWGNELKELHVSESEPAEPAAV